MLALNEIVVGEKYIATRTAGQVTKDDIVLVSEIDTNEDDLPLMVILVGHEDFGELSWTHENLDFYGECSDLPLTFCGGCEKQGYHPNDYLCFECRILLPSSSG